MIKVLVHYGDVKPFSIEVKNEEALKILTAYINQDVEIIEVEGYGIYPKETTKLEFSDLV